MLVVMAMLGAGLALPATLVVGPIAPAGASDTFPDVGDTHPFHDEISWFAERGFTNGYPDGTYKPTNAVTRQAIAAHLHRLWLALDNTDPEPLPDPGFTDVGPGHPFYDDISWLAATGLTNGYPDGTFKPGQAVTRQAAAALIHRFWALLGQYETDIANTPFVDVPPSHAFRADIDWFATMTIGQGWPDGRYQPGQPVTRQATAAFIMRLAATLGLFPHDYDHDGKADYGYIDDDTGAWYTLGSTNPIFTPTATAGGRSLLGGDYDGDGWWEPGSEKDGIWETGGTRGTFTYVPPGQTLDQYWIPVPGNYDPTDPAWEAAYYDERMANWWIEGLDGPIQFGIGFDGLPTEPLVASVWYDVATPADYNGDGVTEIAVYHLTDGTTRTFDGLVPPAVGPKATDPGAPAVDPADIGGTIVGDAEIGFPLVADLDGDLADESIVFGYHEGLWFIGTGPPEAMTVPAVSYWMAIADFDGDFSASRSWFLDESGGFQHPDGSFIAYPESAGDGINIHSPVWHLASIARLTYVAVNCFEGTCPPGINPPPNPPAPPPPTLPPPPGP
jgi:hypothetical protein